jgi:hypothetical protein
MRRIVQINLENLNISEVKKIKKLAAVDELNVFYDRNGIIVALCNKILKEIEE